MDATAILNTNNEQPNGYSFIDSALNKVIDKVKMYLILHFVLLLAILIILILIYKRKR